MADSPLIWDRTIDELIRFHICYVVQLLSHVRLFVIQWIEAHQASLSFTISWSLLKLMPIKLVISSNHLILCHPLLLLHQGLFQ